MFRRERKRKMKKSVLFGIGLALSLPLASIAVAAEKTMGAGIEATVQLPVGNFGDVAGIGLGGSVLYDYDFNPMWAVTGRVGYIYHLEKENGAAKTTYSQIPILVGAKYTIGPDLPLFITGEVGLYMVTADADVTIGGTTFSASSDDTKLGISVGAGYPLGPVDLKVNLSSWDVGHFGDTMGIGVSVAWNFWSM